jgi:hypothetical protein
MLPPKLRESKAGLVFERAVKVATKVVRRDLIHQVFDSLGDALAPHLVVS